MSAEVVGLHEPCLRLYGLFIYELELLYLGLFGLGGRLAGLYGSPKGGAKAVGGVHAPGLAGEYRLFVLLGNVEID